jgi:hypothetical protein
MLQTPCAHRNFKRRECMTDDRSPAHAAARMINANQCQSAAFNCNDLLPSFHKYCMYTHTIHIYIMPAAVFVAQLTSAPCMREFQPRVALPVAPRNTVTRVVHTLHFDKALMSRRTKTKRVSLLFLMRQLTSGSSRGTRLMARRTKGSCKGGEHRDINTAFRHRSQDTARARQSQAHL